MQRPQTKHTDQRNAVLPRFAVPFAWICLCAQLSGFAHFMLVRHEICPEHDAIMEIHHDGNAHTLRTRAALHVSQRHDQPSDPAHGASAALHIGQQHDDTQEPSSAEHDHCVLAALQRTQITTSPCAETALTQVDQRIPFAPSHTVYTDAIAIYAIAPKNSPPSI